MAVDRACLSWIMNGLPSCRSCAQLQVLELVRCVRTSLGSLRIIAAHSATLQELSLDRSCKGGGGAYRPGYRDIRPLLVRTPDISDA